MRGKRGKAIFHTDIPAALGRGSSSRCGLRDMLGKRGKYCNPPYQGWARSFRVSVVPIRKPAGSPRLPRVRGMPVNPTPVPQRKKAPRGASCALTRCAVKAGLQSWLACVLIAKRPRPALVNRAVLPIRRISVLIAA